MDRIKLILGIIAVILAPMIWMLGERDGGLLAYFMGMTDLSTAPRKDKELLRLGTYSSVKYGFIDKRGQIVIKPEYDDTSSFHEGLCAVRIGKFWGYIDQSGKMVIDPTYEKGGNFCRGLAAVRTHNHWNYIDHKGRFLVEEPTNWLIAEDFEGEIAGIRTSQGRSIIDRHGRTVIGPLQAVEEVIDGVSRIEDHRRQGFVTAQGKIISEPKFNDAAAFSEGLAAVKVDEKWGYINTAGTVVIAPQFKTAQPFHRGWATVSTDTGFGIISRAGKFVIQPKYKHLIAVPDVDYRISPQLSAEGFTPIVLDGKWGFADNRTGQIVIRADYCDARAFSEGLAQVGVGSGKIDFDASADDETSSEDENTSESADASDENKSQSADASDKNKSESADADEETSSDKDKTPADAAHAEDKDDATTADDSKATH